jgi:hypothetical protein
MGTRLAIRTKTSVRFYDIKDSSKTLTLIKGRLYDTHQELGVKDKNSNESVILYDVDATQPYGTARPINNDLTFRRIDLAKAHGGKQFNVFGSLSKIDSKWLFIGAGIVVLIFTGGL